MFGLGMPEIIIIVVLILLLFGGRKIPELMRGVGKGMRSFKEGLNEVEKSVNIDEPAPEKEQKEKKSES